MDRSVDSTLNPGAGSSGRDKTLKLNSQAFQGEKRQDSELILPSFYPS